MGTIIHDPETWHGNPPKKPPTIYDTIQILVTLILAIVTTIASYKIGESHGYEKKNQEVLKAMWDESIKTEPEWLKSFKESQKTITPADKLLEDR